MPESMDRLSRGVIDLGEGITRQVGKHLGTFQGAISLNPDQEELTDALGKEATSSEREAYRQGHRSGWYKGALMFGSAILAGLAVMTLAISGESSKGHEENLFQGPGKKS